MLAKDVRIGARYTAVVSGRRIEVETVSVTIVYGRTRYIVRNVHTGQILPKSRTPAALTPVGKTTDVMKEYLGAVESDPRKW